MNELLLAYLSRYFLTYARASVLRDIPFVDSNPRIVGEIVDSFHTLKVDNILALAQGALSKSLSWMDGGMIFRFRRLSMRKLRHFATHKLHGRLDLISHLFISRMHVH